MNWLKTENILNGFPINRNDLQNMQLYVALSVNGEVKKKKGDFNKKC